MTLITNGLKTLLVIGIFNALAVSAESQLPPIINNYPNCDYSVIDTVKRSQSLSPRPDNAEIDAAMQRILRRLRKEAGDQRADSLALIDKTLTIEESRPNRLTVEAQLIKSCSTSATASTGSFTPLSSTGKRHIGFKRSMRITYNFEIAFPSKLIKPPLPASTLISPESGVYGIALNASMSKVLEQFGTPSFMFSPKSDWDILSYGRDHWLTFHNSVLKKASSNNTLFSYSFLNNVPFDDRFDNRQWRVAKDIGKDDIISDEIYDRLSGVEYEGAVLELNKEEYLKNNQQYRSVVLNGFSLAMNNFSLPDDVLKELIDKNNAVLSTITSHLLNGKKSITIDMLDQSPFGVTQELRGRRFQLFDAFTLIETSGESIYKIHVDPDYLSSLASDSRQWQFGDFYYGQSLDDALKVAGAEAEHFGGSIVIEHNNYSLKLLTYGVGKNEHIYAMELFLPL